MTIADLVHQCYLDPALFPTLCLASGVESVLAARNWTMSQPDIDLINAKINELNVQAQRLYTWLFKNTTEKSQNFVLSPTPGGVTWP